MSSRRPRRTDSNHLPEQPSAPLRAALRIKLVPNAKRSEVAGEHGDAVKIRISAPAVDGKANAALLEFLASALSLPARSITLVQGEKSRDKTVEVLGLDEATVRLRLLKDA